MVDAIKRSGFSDGQEVEKVAGFLGIIYLRQGHTLLELQQRLENESMGKEG
jgi:hypothetical protein